MRNHQLPGRSPVYATNGMAATSQPLATETAIRILREGGNAMDAAIAASATLAVVESYSAGIGGDCYMLYHQAAEDRLHALNGSGRSAAAASIDALRARGHTQMPEQGIHSVTVPGAIDAWYQASQRFGALDFEALLQPAIDYAEQGYAVSPVIAWNWQKCEALLAQTPEASAAYLVDGRAPAAGTIHRQPDLARSLRTIAAGGSEAFYRGAIAEEIVRYSQSVDGLLSLDDFAAHESEWVEPVRDTYRGYEVCEIPPNAQGITVLMALNILEQTRVGDLPYHSPDHVHLLSEAFTLAMAERDRYVADPAFAEVPVEQLLSEEFARAQFARIDMQRALAQPVASALPKHPDTVYLTVVDRDRNVCSCINSTFFSFGSGLVAGNTGISLQNRGAGFVLEEGHFNRLQPGKRPMHTIIPAVVYRDGKPVLGFGVMGGQYQAMGQTYVLSNWIDYGMDIQQALDAARFLLYDGVLDVEVGIPVATRKGLADKGHKVVELDGPHGGGQGIVVDWDKGVLVGGSDPRKDGCALGY
ncbi:MAG: gamma-glutamyltransferase [Gammaproteobacteria bacterium]|nr:gamma-glutamyltransferase [Gammaproteobacteria bacterium]